MTEANKLRADSFWNEFGEHWDDVIAAHAAQHPGRSAIVFRDERISYPQLRDAVQQCAGLLRSHGIGRGDTVALLAPPRPEAMILFLAAASIGAVWLGLSPKYQVRELSYFLAHAQPKLILSIDAFEGVDYTEKLSQTLNELSGSNLPAPIYFEGASNSHEALLDRLRGLAPVDAPVPASGRGSPDDPALLVYTSGTTGKPKGALLRHRSLVYRARVQAEQFATKAPATVINFAPINHVGGMLYRGLSQLAVAGTIVYQERFQPPEIMALIERHQVNVLMLGPTMLQMLLDEPSFDINVFKRMEWFVFAGAPLPAPTLKKIQSYCPVGTAYGLTESTSSIGFVKSPEPVELIGSTVGRPILDDDMRVVDELGEVAEDGQRGELQVRAEHCMVGYLRDEEATRKAITADGWMNTGDVAVRLPSGHFQLVGRLKEMYKSGGYNIYPREIELVLEDHHLVNIAAVIAVDDPRFQQVGHAFVQLAPGVQLSEAELVAWCRERMANYKVPKRFVVCEALPLLPIGKVNKAQLRELASAASV
jgi:acyl-CoA synthetase (AMP-forming)/AMP-acid ligase II